MIKLSPSRVLQKLRSGQTVFSYKINSSCSRIVELAAVSGFDCIWLCNEHTTNNWETLEKQVLAARAEQTDVMIRVSRGDYSDLVKPFEMDASGIMVPHLMSADEAREIARFTRFHPIGRRPVDGGGIDGRFCLVPPKEYITFANANRFVAVQIEDPEPLDELDEICRIPGIDMLFFGPGDFSHAIGELGNLDHHEVCRARKMIADKANQHHKFAGTMGTLGNYHALQAMGYQFINLGGDVISVGNDCRHIMDSVHSRQE